MAEVLDIEVADRVATVTLNRPEVRNALDRELRGALQSGMAALDAEAGVDVVVLTGTDPAFCAGLDLKELGAEGRSADDALAARAETPPWERGPIPRMSKPVIGAINGPAVTGGFELALWCDLLVASDRAAFADTHARVGLMPGWGLSVLLPQAVGVRRAREMSATGNYVDAHTALVWGLVNHVVPHGDLLPFARTLAADIASSDQRAVARIMRTYAEGSLVGMGDAWHIEAEVARAWQGGGIDATAIEARRLAIVERGRSQV